MDDEKLERILAALEHLHARIKALELQVRVLSAPRI